MLFMKDLVDVVGAANGKEQQEEPAKLPQKTLAKIGLGVLRSLKPESDRGAIIRIAKREGVSLHKLRRLVPVKISKREFTRRNVGAKRSRGRPSNAKVPDAAIKEILMRHFSPSCRFSSKGEPWHLLDASLKMLHRRVPELRKLLSYSQLCHRSRRGKLGLVRGKEWTDLCEVCVVWDREVETKIYKAWQDCTADLEGIQSDYFANYNAAIDADKAADTDWKPYEDVENAKQWLSYMESRAALELHKRSSLPDGQLDLLERLEAHHCEVFNRL